MGAPTTPTQTLPVGEKRSAQLEAALLIVRRSGQETHRFALLEGKVVIGSGADCGLVIKDRSVSRRHLEVELVPGAVRVQDLSSTNGTRYQGAWIQQVLVPFGGTLLLGKAELRIERASAPVEARFGPLLSRSPVMMAIIEQLPTIASAEAPVLLEGEPGTGKEVLARTLHEQGSRAARPFVVVDCASLPKRSAESELFGHERGALPGARESSAGAFRRAAGGTLFLDGVAEMPLDIQPLVLRTLEKMEIRPVGGATYLPIDVRLIASSNEPLAAIPQGRLRSDLRQRLAVLRLELPPLRSRREDIPLLVQNLLDSAARSEGISVSPEILSAMGHYDWPGNLRELRTVVERAMSLSGSTPVDPSTLGLPVPTATAPEQPVDYAAARELALAQFEREFLLHLLRRFGGNVSEAARQAGMDRVYLHRLLRKHGLKARSR